MSEKTMEKFLAELEHPLKDVVHAAREVILQTNPELIEHIKWNAPSYVWAGEDRITFNLHSPKFVRLIFHRGAKVKSTDNFKFEDPTGLLEWPAVDRGILKITSSAEFEKTKAAIAMLIAKWLEIAA